MVQGISDEGDLDSVVIVGCDKNLSDSLIYSEVELTGFPKEFVIWYERVELRIPSSILPQTTEAAIF